MKRFLKLLALGSLAVGALSLGSASAFAQAPSSQTMHVGNLEINDGAGHTLVLQMPTSLGSGTFSFPDPSTVTPGAVMLTSDYRPVWKALANNDVFTGFNVAPKLDHTGGPFTGVTQYGLNISLTNTGTNPPATSIGALLSATGGTAANYGLLVTNGNVGIGNAAPTSLLSVGATEQFKVTSTGNMVVGGSGTAASDAQTTTIRSNGVNSLSWSGMGAFGGTAATAVLGQLNSLATIGGHSATLATWSDLYIQPTNTKLTRVGSAVVPTKTLDVDGTFGVSGIASFAADVNLGDANTDLIAFNGKANTALDMNSNNITNVGTLAASSFTAANIYGGTAAAATLNLEGSSNAAPVGDQVTLTTGNAARVTVIDATTTVGNALAVTGTADLNGAVNIGNADADAVAINTTGNFSIASNAFDVSTAGAVSGATGISSSGTITLSGLTAKGVVTTDATSNLVSTALTNGQLFIGSTGNVAAAASLTGTTNQITVTPGAGSITLATPQNIDATATPTFGGLTITPFTTAGVVHNSIAGLLSSSAVNLASNGAGGDVTGTLAVSNGGTGAATLTSNGVLLGNGTAAVGAVPVSTVNGQFLQATTVGAAPTWKTLLSVANGGTGLNSVTSNAIVYGAGTGVLNVLPVNATASPLFLSQVSSGAPSWSDGGTSFILNQNAGAQTPASYNIAGQGTISYPTSNAPALTVENTFLNIATENAQGASFSSTGLGAGENTALTLTASGSTGTNTALTVTAGGVKITPFSPTAGVVHNSVAGLLFTSAIINADVDAAAAIAYSKLNLAGSIVNADVATGAAIAYSKLATLASGNILVGSGTGVATSTAVTGDVTISNLGVTAIGSGKVTSAMILNGEIVDADVNASAAIAGSKISPNFGSQAVSTTGGISGGTLTATTAASGVVIGTGVNATNLSSTATGAAKTISFPDATGTVALTSGVVNSISGTANRITIGGTTTIPTVDIAFTYAGQTSITTLGTIGTGTWQGTLVAPTYGGTGVNNGSNTLTLGGNLTTVGAFPTTLNITALTSVTLPTSGTLATTANINSAVTGTTGQLAVFTGANAVGNGNLTGDVTTTGTTATTVATTAGPNIRAALNTGVGGTGINIAAGGTGAVTAVAAFDALSPLTTLGDIVYNDGTNDARLAGNITAAKQFLSQTGTGAISAAPAWSAIANTDVSGLGTMSTQNATAVAITGGTGAFTNTATNTAPLSATNTFVNLLADNAQAASFSSTGTGAGENTALTLTASGSTGTNTALNIVGGGIKGAGAGNSVTPSNKFAEVYTLTGGTVTEVISNNKVTAASVVVAVMQTGVVMVQKVAPAAGSFTVTFSAAPAVSDKIMYIVIN